eukprot:m.393197 g.393197  ORF g.393197 m.393197 type:complete len:437 (-) comp20091_c0_seq1:43-1353(-)
MDEPLADPFGGVEEEREGGGEMEVLGDVHLDEERLDLDSFRQQWKAELSSNHKSPGGQDVPDNGAATGTATDTAADDRSEALRLHQEGVRLESEGNLADAVAYYRKAVKLFPDVEYYHYHSQPSAPKQPVAAVDEEEAMAERNPVDEEVPLPENLRCYFQVLGAQCLPRRERNTLHLGALPPEVVRNILFYTVCGDLDLRNIERFAGVCRACYVHARDPLLWRHIAATAYPATPVSPDPWLSWRALCMERPRLLFHGVYISKVTYVRQGEQALDNFYRPFQMVEYRRFLRFFPDGTVLACTSADDPSAVVNRMRLSTTGDRKIQVLPGTYQVHNDLITVSVRRVEQHDGHNQRQARRNPRGGQRAPPLQRLVTFVMLLHMPLRRHLPMSKLAWRQYTSEQRDLHQPMAAAQVTEYELNDHYRPFVFSRVRSMAHHF